MAPPSALHIATQSVRRLVKEEASYHKELAGQEARVKKLADAIKAGGPDLDENAEFQLRQEEAAVAETKNVFGPLRQRISEAVQKLEEQIALSYGDAAASADEVEQANEVLASGKKAAQGEGEV